MPKLLIFAAIFVAADPIAARADGDECGSCQVKAEAKDKLRSAQRDYETLLQKNKDFLAKLGADDSSKLIKVSSNITLLNIKLEGINKNIADLDQDIRKSCGACDATGQKAPQKEANSPSKGK